MLFAFVILAVGSLFRVSADGHIVPNGVVSNYGGFFAPEEISVLHNPNNPNAPGSYTGFLFEPQPTPNMFLFSPVVDIGVRVFFVSAGDPISQEALLGGNYPELISGDIYSFTTSFYVGLYTGNDPTNPQPGGIYNDPLFGWARLRNVNGSIQILSSALEYQGGGIIAGSQTILPVPEPGTLALAILGGLLVGIFHLRKKLNRRLLMAGESGVRTP
jgi:hypothetical protein